MKGFAALIGGIAGLALVTAAQAGTFDSVKANGFVQCGVNTGVEGFSSPKANGEWAGLDIDLCRAIAAAMFGDASKTKFKPTTSQTRFIALQTGEIDVLTRNATQTLSRDTTLALHMAGVNFYDGQGFMVRRSMGLKSVKDLNGATICVQPGTTTELNMSDWFRKNAITFKPVVIEQVNDLAAAFFSDRCDALTTDASQLAAIRASTASKPDDYVILPERISKEPLGPMVRKDDNDWFAVVKWVLAAMVEAEELGVSQANVDKMLDSSDPQVKRLLGVGPGYGKALKLDEKWAYNIIKQVGNYGDSFERNLGSGSAIKLDRGLNRLWTEGGIMYAIPLR